MTPNRVDVLASTKEYLIRAVTEAKAVLRETTNQCARLWAHLAARLRLRSLKREFTTIRLWLASDMAETGVGDERLRQQIAILDERIKSIMAANGSTRALRTVSRGLQLRLTEPLLQQEIAPAEIARSHGELKTAQAKVEKQLQIVVESQSRLFPASSRERQRLAIGVCVPLVFGFLAFRLAAGTTASAIAPLNENPLGDRFGLLDASPDYSLSIQRKSLVER